jgi:serralysin
MNRRFRFSMSPIAALCALAAAAVSAAPARAFDIVNRWTATQVNGQNLQRGDPVTLRWSIVPDGKSYSRSANSQVIQFLDDGWNVPAAQRMPDFTNRLWWTVINNAYAQYARVSGITLVYAPEQNATGQSTGTVGDIRIGGENIDGTPGGALADNTFPNDGDMRIDTTREANGSVGSYFSTEPGLRNLVIHETGHGVGLGHVDFVNNSAKAIMEGGLRTDIWGLQFDDAYALNRQYGDPQERNGGNNIPSTATSLGAVAVPSVVSVGGSALDSVVNQFDADWLGIDGINDTDWFKFSIPTESFARIRVRPIGPTYETVQQGVFNASAQSDLAVRIYSGNTAATQIASRDLGGLGQEEDFQGLFLDGPGDFLIRVNGKQDLNQFYRIDMSLSDLPAPSSTADVNLDGLTNIDDWTQFLATGYTNLAEFTRREAFERGDLDLDGDNDFTDFRLFKSLYDVANGVGAFARMASVPEPAGLVILAAVGVGLPALRRRRRA